MNARTRLSGKLIWAWGVLRERDDEFLRTAHRTTSVQSWLRRERAPEAEDERRAYSELRAARRRRQIHVWRPD